MTKDETYAIVSDYLGTPVEMYDSEGKQVWNCELDIYGEARILAKGEKKGCPCGAFDRRAYFR